MVVHHDAETPTDLNLPIATGSEYSVTEVTLSDNAQDPWRKRRRDNIIQTLTANGFPHAPRHYCTAVDSFVRNLFKLDGSRMRGRRWTVEDVIQICCKRQLASTSSIRCKVTNHKSPRRLGLPGAKCPDVFQNMTNMRSDRFPVFPARSGPNSPSGELASWVCTSAGA